MGCNRIVAVGIIMGSLYWQMSGLSESPIPMNESDRVLTRMKLRVAACADRHCQAQRATRHIYLGTFTSGLSLLVVVNSGYDPDLRRSASLPMMPAAFLRSSIGPLTRCLPATATDCVPLAKRSPALLLAWRPATAQIQRRTDPPVARRRSSMIPPLGSRSWQLVFRGAL